MVITHNILGMNAQRQFNIAGKKKAKSTEKLSSGFKINRAADDAAGLTISETMRRLIRGLSQGADNIQDGISLCQVAEGALNEVHDMLHRLNELSIKSANGTNTKEDREAIQSETSQILDEINRIGKSTEFNELSLFIQPYTPQVSGRPTDITVFNNGIDENGNITYGGIAYKGYRYSWDDISPSILKQDGTFNPGSYTLRTNEGVEIKLITQEGSAPPQIEREYSWNADNDGITIDSTLIPWSDIVDSSTRESIDKNHLDPNSFYTLEYAGMDISFSVKEGDDFEDLIKGINGDGIKAYTWKSLYEAPVDEQVVILTKFNDGGVLNINSSNKDYISPEITIGADNDGVWIENENGLSKSNTFMSWADMGLTDWSSGSDVSAQKQYRYIDNTSGITFDYRLIEESSKKSVINGLNGAKLSVSVNTQTSYEVSLENASQYSAEVKTQGGALDFYTQRRMGRSFLQDKELIDSCMCSINLDSNYRYRRHLYFDKITFDSSYSNYASYFEANIKSYCDVAYDLLKKATISNEFPPEEPILSQQSGCKSPYHYFNTWGTNFRCVDAIDTFFLYIVPNFTSLKDYIDIDITETNDVDGEIYVEDESNPGGYRLYNKYTDPSSIKRYKFSQHYLDGYDTEKNTLFNSVTEDYNNVRVKLYGGKTTAIITGKANNSSGKSTKFDSIIHDNPRMVNIFTGADDKEQNYIGIPLRAMNAFALGIGNLDVSTEIQAQSAIKRIGSAMEYISSFRSELGAVQNRLEHAYDNQNNVIENTTAAESRIRDTDMAKEVANQAVQNILTQAGIAMMAQANQNSQNVMQLFQ